MQMTSFRLATSAKLLLPKFALAVKKRTKWLVSDLSRCRNGCSRYDLARFVLQEMKIAVGIEKVSKSIFGLPAKRPDYSFMLKKERSGLFQICCRNGCSRYEGLFCKR